MMCVAPWLLKARQNTLAVAGWREVSPSCHLADDTAASLGRWHFRMTRSVAGTPETCILAFCSGSGICMCERSPHAPTEHRLKPLLGDQGYVHGAGRQVNKPNKQQHLYLPVLAVPLPAIDKQLVRCCF